MYAVELLTQEPTVGDDEPFSAPQERSGHRQAPTPRTEIGRGTSDWIDAPQDGWTARQSAKARELSAHSAAKWVSGLPLDLGGWGIKFKKRDHRTTEDE